MQAQARGSRLRRSTASGRWTGSAASRPRGCRRPSRFVEPIVSSPHARCVETVRPLAEALGLAVEERAELEPEAGRRDVLAGLDGPTVVCTHREVVERL